MPQEMLVDLGQFEFELPRGWCIRFDNNPEDSFIYLSNQPALSEMRLFSAFEGDPEEILESFFGQVIYKLRSTGVHVDDLAEESDYEILYEIPNEFGKSEFVHYFFRLIGRLIVELKMSTYFEEDENSIRQLLDSCLPKKVTGQVPNFSQLNFAPKTDSWSRMGGVYMTGARTP